jgi:hypothetical protein
MLKERTQLKLGFLEGRRLRYGIYHGKEIYHPRNSVLNYVKVAENLETILVLPSVSH